MKKSYLFLFFAVGTLLTSSLSKADECFESSYLTNHNGCLAVQTDYLCTNNIGGVDFILWVDTTYSNVGECVPIPDYN
jgi:hypothetical protein